MPAGEPLLRGRCAVRVLRTPQCEGQVYVSGPLGCRWAISKQLGTGLGHLPARAAAQGRARCAPSQELSRSLSPSPISSSSLSLSFLSLSQCRRAHTHTHIHTHTRQSTRWKIWVCVLSRSLLPCPVNAILISFAAAPGATHQSLLPLIQASHIGAN